VSTPETPVVIDPEVLAAARALYRAYAAEDSADAERAASARYDAAAAVYALTPEQAVFLAGRDAGEAGRALIVLPRVDVERNDDMRGDRYRAEDRPPADGWYVLGTDHVVFGGTGDISPDEAFRFAAALVSQAYAVKAAQAEQGGGDDA